MANKMKKVASFQNIEIKDKINNKRNLFCIISKLDGNMQSKLDTSKFDKFQVDKRVRNISNENIEKKLIVEQESSFCSQDIKNENCDNNIRSKQYQQAEQRFNQDKRQVNNKNLSQCITLNEKNILKKVNIINDFQSERIQLNNLFENKRKTNLSIDRQTKYSEIQKDKIQKQNQWQETRSKQNDYLRIDQQIDKHIFDSETDEFQIDIRNKLNKYEDDFTDRTSNRIQQNTYLIENNRKTDLSIDRQTKYLEIQKDQIQQQNRWQETRLTKNRNVNYQILKERKKRQQTLNDFQRIDQQIDKNIYDSEEIYDWYIDIKNERQYSKDISNDRSFQNKDRAFIKNNKQKIERQDDNEDSISDEIQESQLAKDLKKSKKGLQNSQEDEDLELLKLAKLYGEYVCYDSIEGYAAKESYYQHMRLNHPNEGKRLGI